VTELGATARASRVRRLASMRSRMEATGVDALLLSHGADLPWLTGYEAMPLERLTVLVLPLVGEPTLVVPGLEAPRVARADELFTILPWSDDEDPIAITASLLESGPEGKSRHHVAISDRAWATSVLALQARLPDRTWQVASLVTSPVRAVKDPSEVAALRAAGAAADRVASVLQSSGIALVGRTEAEVSADISSMLLAEGHQQVNFAIVGSGPNAASPHHEAGTRVIQRGETVVCDFGGSYSLDGEVGYCSDITRTVVTGEPTMEVRNCYDALQSAQQAAVSAARAGVTAEHVDRVARGIITEAGYGEYFIHRTGHGIGIEAHEDPYLVSGNREVLAPGHAFSVEPGIYLPGRFGMRLEDIVIIDDDGEPDPLNRVDHSLVVIDG
jgi:Xaa-Pro aminopeptidase